MYIFLYSFLFLCLLKTAIKEGGAFNIWSIRRVPGNILMEFGLFLQTRKWICSVLSSQEGSPVAQTPLCGVCEALWGQLWTTATQELTLVPTHFSRWSSYYFSILKKVLKKTTGRVGDINLYSTKQIEKEIF